MARTPAGKLLQKSLLIIGACLALGLVGGCSGGGSGPPPVLNYSGVTTPVAITEENAKAILLGAYEGGLLSSTFNILGGVQAGQPVPAGLPRTLDLAETLETFLYALDLEAQQPSQYTGAIITDSETIFGSCGGSVYYDVELNSIFGDFSGTADFREYCDAANPDLILDGVTDFSGDYEVFSFEIDDFSFIFRDLSVTSDAGSFILNGSLNGSVSAVQADLLTTSVLEDVSTAKTYWLKDFRILAVQGSGFIDIDVSGRYYDHDYGYVDVITQGPFRIYDQDSWPSSGILLVEGAEGDAGGKTMAKMVVLDADSFQVEADTDGDGLFDDYDSGPLSWSSL